MMQFKFSKNAKCGKKELFIMLFQKFKLREK